MSATAAINGAEDRGPIGAQLGVAGGAQQDAQLRPVGEVSGGPSQPRAAGLAAQRPTDGVQRRDALAEGFQPRFALDPRQGLGPIHRLMEAAQLIDKAKRLGLGAGPHPAARDLPHPVGGQAPALRHPRDEAIVDVIHQAEKAARWVGVIAA